LACGASGHLCKVTPEKLARFQIESQKKPLDDLESMRSFFAKGKIVTDGKPAS